MVVFQSLNFSLFTKIEYAFGYLIFRRFSVVYLVL